MLQSIIYTRLDATTNSAVRSMAQEMGIQISAAVRMLVKEALRVRAQGAAQS